MPRVALIGENSIEFISELLDIWNDGNCAVLIDWQIPVSEMMRLIAEANIEQCVVDVKFYNSFISEKRDDIIIRKFKSTNKTVFLPSYIRKKYQSNYTNKEAIVVYSSGTTGVSKGVILSHFAINSNADAVLNYMKLEEKDIIYIVKSFMHSSTLVGELLVGLKSGASLLISSGIVLPRIVLKNLLRFNVTTICLNPVLLEMISNEQKKTNYSFKYLKAIYCSGSILYDRIYELANSSFYGKSIYNVYGLSEAGPRVSAQNEMYSKSNSVGVAIQGVKICIVNESGSTLQCGEIGVVHIKSPYLYSGYVVGVTKHQPFIDGWFNTGDVGFFDDNKELHITGRYDDTIIINSKKIYPSSIENEILLDKRIKECIVFTNGSGHKIKICCAFVSESDIRKEIISRLKKRFAPFEIPQEYYVLHTLPKNKNDKIDRITLLKTINDLHNN